ncbi:beta-N-acetylhexosaminidase [Streptosporangium saharense]|uniref:beta-N-acetylhexosaminidase n=1 Tax=Streptosporangium saharense TaxID=1706840 RepID=UPI003682287C
MAPILARLWRSWPARIAAVLVLVLGAGAVTLTTRGGTAPAPMGEVLPVPVSVRPAGDVSYTLAPDAAVHTEAGSAEAAQVGAYLAGLLRPSTGYALPVVQDGQESGVSLLLTGADPVVGSEGYQLDVTEEAVVIRARTGTGLFNGVQTLRQLLPPRIESATAVPGPWTVRGGRIVDYPRFPYRGAMLDVARHFHPVETVRRYIDRIVLYKINYLHLHLSDDQGWRIAVDSRPRLTEYGGRTQVGGGPGGHYTKEQYREIVEYAAQRHVTVVPEIDLPGHTNAALASYAELNCDGKARKPYTGTDVGFSTLCTTKEETYAFVRDVLGEIAALTPGPYLHLGGDEATATPPERYAAFMNRVQPMVAATGKTVMGWHQIGEPEVRHQEGRVLQYWGRTGSDPLVAGAVAKGARVVMSPANRAYLDMKYDEETVPGQKWAGYVEVRDAYDWDPGSHLEDVPASAVLGVEAPLWTEAISTEKEIEYMAFPRLPAIAELGWSPRATHDWTAFARRLGAQGPRWAAMDLGFHHSPQVTWDGQAG